jgi:hypothetical protein
MNELTREEQTATINKLNGLQTSLDIVDEVIKHKGSSTVLETEKHQLMVQIDKLQTKIGHHFAAKDANQRAQI